MKRMITLSVEVNDDEHYADVLASLINRPEVTAWAATRTGAGRKPTRATDYLLMKHGIVSRFIRGSTCQWVKEHG